MTALVESWFGVAFAELHPLLQALHRNGGTLTGSVDSSLGKGLAGIAGKRLALRLGLSKSCKENQLEVSIFSDAHSLHWNRKFNKKHEFKSVFLPQGTYPNGYWSENTGWLTIAFKVAIINGGWYWQQIRASLWGVPLPEWLMPHVLAHKEVVDNLYHFSVEIRLPVLGKILSYTGRLALVTPMNAQG